MGGLGTYVYARVFMRKRTIVAYPSVYTSILGTATRSYVRCHRRVLRLNKNLAALAFGKLSVRVNGFGEMTAT